MGTTDVSILGKGNAIMARIFIASNNSWNLFNFRYQLIKALVEDGHQIICICPSDDYNSKLTSLGIKHINVFLSRASVNPLRDLFTIINYIILFLLYRPDYYLGFTIKPNIYGGIVSRLFKTKSIHNISGLGYSFIKKGWLLSIVSFLYRLALSNAHHVFFQNSDDMKLFLDKKLCKPVHASILPGSGVDTNYFHPVKKYKKKKKFRFLMVSRLLVDKGVREFVAAAEELAGNNSLYEFFLVGSLDEKNPSSISKQELNGWIERGIIKYQSHTDDIRKAYCSANCIVLPSYREGAPRTLIEAGAMGIPAITTNVPGCRYVVRDNETGLLANVRDVSDLKAKMKQIHDMKPERLEQMEKAARVYIKNEFCVTKIINSYHQQITKPI